MKKKQLLIPLFAAIAGAVAGFLYYKFVGCISGTCPISGNPIVSTIYGAVIGVLIGIIIMPSKKKKGDTKDE